MDGVAGTVWGDEYKEDWREMIEVIERTGREWMVLLLVVCLCGETSAKIIDVKLIKWLKELEGNGWCCWYCLCGWVEYKDDWRGERFTGENVVC